MDAFSPQCISSSARSALRCHCLLALCRRGRHCSPLMRSPAEEVVHSKPLATEFSAHRCHPLHAESPPLRPPPTSPSPPPRASPLPICYASRLPPRYTTHHPRGASLMAKVLRPPLSTEVPLLPRVLHFSVISFAPPPPHAWWPSPLPACSSSLRMPGRLRRPPFAYQKCTLLLETMTNDLMT
jgi:hypothetical protein